MNSQNQNVINLQSEYARKYSLDNNKTFLSDRKSNVDDTVISNRVKFAEPLDDPIPAETSK